jgi:2-methylcitrate dehydratase PrpD
MGRITVRVDDALDALHPATVTWQVTATTLSGRATTIEIVNPKGHPDNPMGDEDITNKFLSCATPELGRDRAMGAAREWWQISQDGARVRSAFAALSQAAR